MFKLVWQRPELWQSHVVLLVLVLLVLAWGFCGVDWFLFDNGAVGLCRVADVVATLIHVVWTFVSVPVFVHSVKQDKNTQRSCCYNANHHPCCAAGLPEDLRRAWVGTLWSSASGIGWKGYGNMITTNVPYLLPLHFIIVTITRFMLVNGCISSLHVWINVTV